MSNNKPVIATSSGTNLGTISVNPTVKYWVYDYDGDDLSINVYLDRKTLWVGGRNAPANPSNDYSYQMTDDTWQKYVFDGPHTLYFEVSDSKGATDETWVTFTRIGNPENVTAPMVPPATINPVPAPFVPPAIPDCGDVQMGVLRHTHRYTHGRQEVTNIVQGTSSCFTNKPVMVEIGKRDSDGWLINAHADYNEQVTFVDTENSAQKWKWIKTTIDGKSLFISTTMGPKYCIHPTSRINVTLNGVKYILRHLTQREWMKIDTNVLDRIDFGSSNILSSWDIFYILTCTPHGHHDASIFTTTTEKNNYNGFVTSNMVDPFFAMSYFHKEKAKHHGCRHGWSRCRPCDYHHHFPKHSDVFRWLPVLELVNSAPVIELPDKDKDDPTIKL